MMKTCSTSPLLMMTLVYFTLPVLEAQEVRVVPEVTGYLRHGVTLPCQFIQGPEAANITQVQWDLQPPEGVSIIILVANHRFGVRTPESPLKGRLELAEQSLIIKDVQMADAGLYACTIVTYPNGTFRRFTNLVVEDSTVILPRMIAAGVFLLIVATMLATTYVIIIRIRRKASVTMTAEVVQ